VHYEASIHDSAGRHARIDGVDHLRANQRQTGGGRGRGKQVEPERWYRWDISLIEHCAEASPESQTRTGDEHKGRPQWRAVMRIGYCDDNRHNATVKGCCLGLKKNNCEPRKGGVGWKRETPVSAFLFVMLAVDQIARELPATCTA
jgi:hypothetical protein